MLEVALSTAMAVIGFGVGHSTGEWVVAQKNCRVLGFSTMGRYKHGEEILKIKTIGLQRQFCDQLVLTLTDGRAEFAVRSGKDIVAHGCTDEGGLNMMTQCLRVHPRVRIAE